MSARAAGRSRDSARSCRRTRARRRGRRRGKPPTRLPRQPSSGAGVPASQTDATLVLLTRTLLSLLGVGALVLVIAVVARPASAQRTWDAGFHSTALAGTLHFEVVLPVDYATSGRRYPVVYFLHGLPAKSEDYRGLGFVQNALDGLGPKAILVVPQGARGGDSDPEYLDQGPGRRWATAIAAELPRVIDARYRTIASRQGRALIGLS